MVDIDLTTVEELYSSLSIFIQEVRTKYDQIELQAIAMVGTDKYSADERRQCTRRRHHDEIAEDFQFTG